MRRSTRSLRIAVAIGAAAAFGLVGVAAAPASATSSSLQAQIDAAPAGATIRLPAGTFPGGVTIEKSLTLIGAGAGKTVLRGGDSVVRIATPTGQRPSVTFVDLTITGGVARAVDPTDPYEAFGGGIFVEPAGADDQGLGADLTLRRVVVSGNRAEASTTIASGEDFPCPGGQECPFAESAGGGVASFGNLTLDHAVIQGNAATGRVSDADGGGVWSGFGSLRILSSTISGNRAEPTANEIGRFAEGGGVFAADTDPTAPLPLTVEDSAITANSASLATRYPVYPSPDSQDGIAMSAHGGGMQVGVGYATTIDRTSISGNHVAAIDPQGSPAAFDSGLMQVYQGTIAVTRSAIDHNTAKVVAENADIGGPSGNAVEVDGTATISDTSISGNTVDASGTGGSAQASNGLAVYSFNGSAGIATVTRSTISANTATAKAPDGDALIVGVGVFNNSVLTLTDSVVSKNCGTITSSGGTAQGGGAWNGAFLSGPPVSLTVRGTLITGNRVSARNGTAQGGGLYNAGGDGVTYALRSTSVVNNAPDQIYDASTAPAAAPLLQSSAKQPASRRARALDGASRGTPTLKR